MSVRKAITPRSPSASLTRTHPALNSHLLCDTMAVLGWQDDSVVGCLQPSLSLIPEPTWFRTYSCRFSLDFHTYEHITYNMYEHMSTHTNLQGIHFDKCIPYLSSDMCNSLCGHLQMASKLHLPTFSSINKTQNPPVCISTYSFMVMYMQTY